MQDTITHGILATKNARSTQAFYNRVVTVLLILLLGGPLAGYLLIYNPLENAVKANIVSTFSQISTIKFNTLNQAIVENLNRAKLVSDRAMIRRAMESYHAGELTFDELREYSQERYDDIASGFSRLLMANRFIDDRSLLSYIPRVNSLGSSLQHCFKNHGSNQKATICFENDNVLLCIYSPVTASHGEIIGYDYLTFDFTSSVAALTDDASGIELLSTEHITPIIEKGKLIESDDSGVIYLSESVYYWVMPISEELYFVSSIPSSTLLLSLKRLSKHILFNSFLVYATLLFIIIFYILRFAQRELLLREIDQGTFNKAITDAKIDYLTKIENRRSAEESLAEHFKHFLKSGKTPPIMLFDVDRFKWINDTYGHALGDKVLVAISDAVLLLIGDEGSLYRWGGDEFLLIVTGADMEHVEKIAQQLLTTIDQVVVDAEETKIHPTISMGISSFWDNDVVYLETVTRADKAMYWAKANSGNGYTIYSENEESLTN